MFLAQIACGCLVFLTVALMRDVPLAEDDGDDDDDDDEEGEDED